MPLDPQVKALLDQMEAMGLTLTEQATAEEARRRVKVLPGRAVALEPVAAVEDRWHVSTEIRNAREARAKEFEMAKLRHFAIATQDPDKTAQFYIDVFGMQKISAPEGPWGRGYLLTDGTINFAVLKFNTDAAAGVELGASYSGLHHLGFEVDDLQETARKIEACGGRARTDIDAALGLEGRPSRKGEFKFAGPDGVVFDLGEHGFWKNEPAMGTGRE